MWRLIFLGLIIWLAIHIFKRVVKQPHSRQPDTIEPDGNNAENMVQCVTCHVHLPRSEAFLVEGSFYCSQAHILKK